MSGPHGPVLPAGPHQLFFSAIWRFYIPARPAFSINQKPPGQKARFHFPQKRKPPACFYPAPAISCPSKIPNSILSPLFKVTCPDAIGRLGVAERPIAEHFKKVKWRASPASSMSPVRTHFWILATLFPPGCRSPSRYGTNGCIPAVVKSAVGSVSLGTSEDDGIIACPLVLKNSKNFF